MVQLFSMRRHRRVGQAAQLANLLSSDLETQRVLADPDLAQYLYVSYFADRPSPSEIEVTFQDLASSNAAGDVDLYDLLNQKLEPILSDPQKKTLVESHFKGLPCDLRPQSLRVFLYPVIRRIMQVLQFPKVLARLRKLVRTSFSQEAMERALFDFYGATQLGLKDSLLRPWKDVPGSFSSVRPNQIQRMSPISWVKMALFAAETEMPIHGYSTTSGDAFRAFLPSLSAYMGKTKEQEQAYDAAHPSENKADRPSEFCSSVWCQEETRHELTIQKIAEHVSGTPYIVEKTYSSNPLGDFSDSDYSIKHLVDRNCSEWHANALYIYLRSFSSGAASQLIDNVRGDETKHLIIFGAAYRYLFGTQPNRRLREMFKTTLELKHAGETTNSSRDALLQLKGLPLLEIAIGHFFIEKKVRDYLKTVPLKTLAKIFDSSLLAIAQIESDAVSDVKQKLIDEVKNREQESRKALARWRQKEATKYLELQKIEKEYAEQIENLVRRSFNDFDGSEIRGSLSDKETLACINKIQTGLGKKINTLIQWSLRETLRDYQIMNNEFVRSCPNLKVYFAGAQTGFTVEKEKTKEEMQKLDALPFVEGEDPYVCYCRSVLRSQVRNAVANGAHTLSDIKTKTRASTGCGECEGSLESLIAAELRRFG